MTSPLSSSAGSRAQPSVRDCPVSRDLVDLPASRNYMRGNIMSEKKPHILVVGAGIGGLAAAIGLRKAGCSVELHERAEQLRPVGAGLTIQPNALMALRHMGVGDTVERSGHLLALANMSLPD